MTPTPAKLWRLGLPTSVDSEKVILGSVILRHANFDAVAAALDASDFALESHQRIFLRMKELHDAGRIIDRITIAEAIDSAGQLDSVGGFGYLVSLDEGLPE